MPRTAGPLAAVIVATLLGSGCGPAATGPQPAAPGALDQAAAAPRGPAPGAECHYLRERVTTAATRLGALMREPEQTAAKFGAVGDVLAKLAADLSVPMARDDVRALASDFVGAAQAAAAAARNVAALLANGEHAKARLAAGTERKAFLAAVRRVADACRDSDAPDCARVVGLLQALGAGVPRASLLEAMRRELGRIQPSTPALRAAVPDVDAALARLTELLTTAETLEREGPRLVLAYEQAARQFSGLNTRGDQLCGGAAPR